MNKNKIKAGILASALAGCLTIGGISAYFTDTDNAINTFTIGKVEIKLEEPSWIPPSDITPEQEIKKDPQVKNTGINDAYIFAEVKIPYINAVTAKDDGTKNPAAEIELFTYELKDGWVELVDERVVDTTEKYVRHLYAYGSDSSMSKVKRDEVTESLFDYIRLVNLVESDELAGKSVDVHVNAYAIQTTNLNDGKTSQDGSNDDGKISPQEVWAVISAQGDLAASS